MKPEAQVAVVVIPRIVQFEGTRGASGAPVENETAVGLYFVQNVAEPPASVAVCLGIKDIAGGAVDHASEHLVWTEYTRMVLAILRVVTEIPLQAGRIVVPGVAGEKTRIGLSWNWAGNNIASG